MISSSSSGGGGNAVKRRAGVQTAAATVMVVVVVLALALGVMRAEVGLQEHERERERSMAVVQQPPVAVETPPPTPPPSPPPTPPPTNAPVDTTWTLPPTNANAIVNDPRCNPDGTPAVGMGNAYRKYHQTEPDGAIAPVPVLRDSFVLDGVVNLIMNYYHADPEHNLRKQKGSWACTFVRSSKQSGSVVSSVSVPANASFFEQHPAQVVRCVVPAHAGDSGDDTVTIEATLTHPALVTGSHTFRNFPLCRVPAPPSASSPAPRRAAPSISLCTQVGAKRVADTPWALQMPFERIEDWVTYHALFHGVDKAIVYVNGDMALYADKWKSSRVRDWIHLVDWDHDHVKTEVSDQHSQQVSCVARNRNGRADWLLLTDVDEYLYVGTDGGLPRLLATPAYAPILSTTDLTFRNKWFATHETQFLPAGYKTPPEMWITDYVWSAEQATAPWRTKVLANVDMVDATDVHWVKSVAREGGKSRTVDASVAFVAHLSDTRGTRVPEWSEENPYMPDTRLLPYFVEVGRVLGRERVVSRGSAAGTAPPTFRKVP